MTSDVTIFTKRGIYYDGNSASPMETVLRADEWQQVYHGIIPTQLRKLVTLYDFNAGVDIGAGQTQSFYVFVNLGMLYTEGNTADAPIGVVAEDDTIVIHEGQVMRGLFQNVAYRGKWGGVMRYRTK